MPSSTPPALHRLLSCVAAPSLALLPRDGQLRGESPQGCYTADRRTVRRSLLTVDAGPLLALSGESAGAGQARFVYQIGLDRAPGATAEDPKILLERRFGVDVGGSTESVRLQLYGLPAFTVQVNLELDTDLAELSLVRSHGAAEALPATATPRGLAWLGADGATVAADAEPAPSVIDASAGLLSWSLSLRTGEAVELSVRTVLRGDPVPPAVIAPPSGSYTATDDPLWSQPEVNGHPALAALLERSLSDLRGLVLADPLTPSDRPPDRFLAAGSPWYLTLFGRDSLWAARMMLPLGTELAGGTLRSLARRQGRVRDLGAEEQPGKILHEIRRAQTTFVGGRTSGGLVLPPVYYGSVDATSLWLILLHDAWRWGLPAEEVAELLEPAEAALRWMRDDGIGPSGFLEYVDNAGTGLANQGWKDSSDAVRFADGRLATPPVALCEVQAYAHEAACSAGALLRAFERPGADEWPEWAAGLATRFRSRFWVDGPSGPFPAIGLDADGHPADTVTSNIGHLLGTGLLDASESALVAQRLASPDMDSGFGLRTLSSAAVAYDPLSYHCGSVWPHDTAITIMGLARAGHDEVATSLLAGLLRAAAAFDFQLPELYGGQPAEAREQAGRRPVPYPASCRPQAWSAATSVHLLNAGLGVAPDVPSGSISARPLRGATGSMSVRGLRVGGAALDVRTHPDGSVDLLTPHLEQVHTRE